MKAISALGTFINLKDHFPVDIIERGSCHKHKGQIWDMKVRHTTIDDFEVVQRGSKLDCFSHVH
jgi:hypothetical protein